MSAAYKNPRRSITVERLFSRVPKAERGNLPWDLIVAEPGTVEACIVLLPQLGGALPDRGGWKAIAAMPDLAEHYADGWHFGHAEQVERGASLEVYLWKEVKL